MTSLHSHTATIHRTRHYTDEQIRHLKESATKQERVIARWFYANPDRQIGPSRLHEEQGYGWPLTSTRRAITNLTDAGILQKAGKTDSSIYGRPEHLWRWRQPQKAVQPDFFN